MDDEVSPIKYRIPWGKFEGEFLEDCDVGYLLWLYDQEFCPSEVNDYVDEHYDDLRSAADAEDFRN